MSMFQSEMTPLLRSISNRPLSGSSFWVNLLKFCRITSRHLKPGCMRISGGVSTGTASDSVVVFCGVMLLLLLLLPSAWTSGDIKSTMTSIWSTTIRAAQNFTKSLNGRRQSPSRTDDTWAHLPDSCYKKQPTMNVHKLLTGNAVNTDSDQNTQTIVAFRRRQAVSLHLV